MRALILGAIVYLALLLGGAAGLTALENWWTGSPDDAFGELRSALAAAYLAVLAAWYALRTRVRQLGERR